MGSKILSIGSYKPKVRVTNEIWREKFAPKTELLENEFTRVMTEGVTQRYYCAPDERAEEVASAAINDCLSKCDVDVKDIDLIIHMSNISDSIFGDSSKIQHHSGAINAASYELKDINCAGSAAALIQAAAFIKAGIYETVLISCLGNSASRAGDMASVMGSGMGDLVTAMLVTKSEEDCGLISCCHKTLGEFSSAFHTDRTDGVKAWPEEHKDKYWHNSFSGLEREHVAVAGKCLKLEAPQAVNKALQAANLSCSDINWLITHQSGRMGQIWRELLGIDKERHPDTLAEVANASLSNLPYTMMKCFDEGKFSPGDNLLLLGAGSGIHLVAIVWRW